MAENKKSFVLYSDLIITLEHLTNEEKGILFNHLLMYVNDMNPVLEDRLLLTAWRPIETQLKRDLEKYKEVKQKRSEAGKKGGINSGYTRSKLNQDEANEANASFVKQTEANEAVNVNDNVNVNDTVNVILLEKETKGENQDFLQSEISEKKENTESVNLETSQKEKSCAKKEKAQPPDLDTFVTRAREIYQNEIKIDFTPYEFAVKAKYQSWIDAGWKDGNKKPIQNWINKLRNTIPHLKPIYGTHNNTKQSNSNGSGYSTGRAEPYQGGKTSFNQILARKLKASSDSESGNITIDAEVVERR